MLTKTVGSNNNYYIFYETHRVELRNLPNLYVGYNNL